MQAPNKTIVFFGGCTKRRLLQTQAVIVGIFAERSGADSFPESVFSNSEQCYEFSTLVL